ncbi:hypothetical protein U1Q18_047985 [Sarracenia purpurea var. burkii]
MIIQVHRNDSIPASLVASELNIPGLYLWHDFITATEEEPECSVLLDALEQSACNPEIAGVVVKSLLRILQLSAFENFFFAEDA